MADEEQAKKTTLTVWELGDTGLRKIREEQFAQNFCKIFSADTGNLVGLVTGSDSYDWRTLVMVDVEDLSVKHTYDFTEPEQPEQPEEAPEEGEQPNEEEAPAAPEEEGKRDCTSPRR